MHNDITHFAYAHYGCRDQRYKIIYWYNEPLDAEGARPGGEEWKEWELFDCKEDPLELFNVWSEPSYKQERSKMVRLLEEKMMEIGDVAVHPAESTDELSADAGSSGVLSRWWSGGKKGT
jgi:hypothetical protein